MDVQHRAEILPARSSGALNGPDGYARIFVRTGFERSFVSFIVWTGVAACGVRDEFCK